MIKAGIDTILKSFGCFERSLRYKNAVIGIMANGIKSIPLRISWSADFEKVQTPFSNVSH